jgi:hypothetical protein
MANKKSVFPALLAAMLVAGLALTGCKQEPDGIPSKLVAVWYADVDSNGILSAGEDIVPVYEFKADGKLLVAGVDGGNTFSVDGDQITVSARGTNLEPITFKVEGKKLTLTGSALSGLLPGTYVKK